MKKLIKVGGQFSDIAKMFGFTNANSYATSSAKKRYETGLVVFYKLVKTSIMGHITKITEQMNNI